MVTAADARTLRASERRDVARVRGLNPYTTGTKTGTATKNGTRYFATKGPKSCHSEITKWRP